MPNFTRSTWTRAALSSLWLLLTTRTEAKEVIVVTSADGVRLVDERGVRKPRLPFWPQVQQRVRIEPSGQLIVEYSDGKDQLSVARLGGAAQQYGAPPNDGSKILRSFERYLPASGLLVGSETWRNGDAMVFSYKDAKKRTPLKAKGLNHKRFFLREVTEQGNYCVAYNPKWTAAKGKSSSAYYGGVVVGVTQSLYCGTLGAGAPYKVHDAGGFFRVQFLDGGRKIVFLTEGVADPSQNKKSYGVYVHDWSTKQTARVTEISVAITAKHVYSSSTPELRAFRSSPFVAYPLVVESHYALTKRFELIDVTTGVRRQASIPANEDLMAPVASGTGMDGNVGFHYDAPSVVTQQVLSFDRTTREVSSVLRVRRVPDFAVVRTVSYKGPLISTVSVIDDAAFAGW